MTKSYTSLLTISITLIYLLALTACNKDDDCVAPAFAENIIGTWNTPAAGDSVSGTATFNSDGTGTASEGSLFSAEINGTPVNDFEWQASGNTLSITNSLQNSATVSYDLESTKNECDKISLNFAGLFTISINRN